MNKNKIEQKGLHWNCWCSSHHHHHRHLTLRRLQRCIRTRRHRHWLLLPEEGFRKRNKGKKNKFKTKIKQKQNNKKGKRNTHTHTSHSQHRTLPCACEGSCRCSSVDSANRPWAPDAAAAWGSTCGKALRVWMSGWVSGWDRMLKISVCVCVCVCVCGRGWVN